MDINVDLDRIVKAFDALADLKARYERLLAAAKDDIKQALAERDREREEASFAMAQAMATIGLVFAIVVIVGSLVCGVVCWLVEGML